MQNNNGSNYLFDVLLTIGGIFGIANVVKYFNKPVEETTIKSLEQIIEEKDRIIEQLELKILRYQKILNDDCK